MGRSLRFRRMEGPTQSLLIVGVCGSVVAAAFGAMAGAGLRIPPRVDAFDRPAVLTSAEDVFLASAPAYPSWAPEPLYPRAERDPVAEFAAAWDAAMMDAPRREPVVFRPPADLPPAYEVRLEGEARPVDVRRAPPPPQQPQTVAYAPPQPAGYGPPPARYDGARPARQDDKAAT